MEPKTELLADKLLRESGMSQNRIDIMRGRKTEDEVLNENRRSQWRIQNLLKSPEKKQIGLMPPTRIIQSHKQSNKGIGIGMFVLGFFFAKWL